MFFNNYGCLKDYVQHKLLSRIQGLIMLFEEKNCVKTN
jgi:hypothetical protein